MPVDYSLGKIYLIENSENDIVYVGSTAQKYKCSRMASHRNFATNKPQIKSPIYEAMRELGVEKFRIMLHHDFPCKSKAELEAEEFKTLNALVKAGQKVYNSFNGKHTDESKQKMRINRKAVAKVGKDSENFSYGCVCFYKSRQAWSFSWNCEIQHKQRAVKFSANKHGGYWQAKALAEAKRREIYPDWVKDQEEEAVEELLKMEI